MRINKVTQEIYEYTENESGFFEELYRLVICLSSISASIEIHTTGRSKPYTSTDTIVLEGKANVSGKELHFFPGPTFDQLLKPDDTKSKSVRIIKQDLTVSHQRHPIVVSNAKLLTARLVGDAFVSYYERKLEIAEEKWGRESEGKWPSVWGFARAIRNACSHNGKIYFKKQKNSEVQWCGLKYSFYDNGRAILFDDLTGVELILLMEEMDSALKKQA